jgi:hypothetical protein
MADVQQPDVQPYSTAQINTQTHTIASMVTDSDTGATLADYTGDNALIWPMVLNTLTPEQQLYIVQQNAMMIIKMKAGIFQEG